MSCINPGSVNVPLPDTLLAEINQFKSLVAKQISMKNVMSASIMAFDEIPLNFIYTG